MNRLEKLWRSQRVVSLKRKLHTLDFVADEAKVDKLRRKREKHMNALLAAEGNVNIKVDKRWSYALDDEEPMVHVIPTHFTYDDEGNDTGFINKNAK
jgi:hypothetical protein